MLNTKNVLNLFTTTAENSISRKLSFILLSSIIAVFVAWGIFSFTSEQKRYAKTARDNTLQAGIRLSASLAVPFWNFDNNGLEKIILSEMQNNDVIAIVINESQSKVYMGRVKNDDGQIVAFSDSLQPKLDKAFYSVSKKIIYMDSKNSNAEPIVIGDVDLYITDFYIKENLRRSLFSLAAQLVLFIIIILFILTRLLDNYIIQRILKLNNSIIFIENGNYNTDIELSGNDEISHIARNIKTMTQTILQREQEYLKLQHYLASIIDSMPSMLISLDQNGYVKQWNMAAAHFTGIEAADAIGKRLWELKPEFEKYIPLFAETIQNNALRVLPRETFRNGHVKYFNVSVFPLIEHDEKGVVFRLDDITEVEHKDEQLRQAQKMETVGTLAGGLAHDFNNVLGGIIGTTSLLQYKISKNNLINQEDLIASIGVIDTSAKRAADIVQQLLVLSRKHETDFTTVDLSLTIKHVVKICQNTFDKSIDISVLSEVEHALVSADPVQMEQVLLNLCVNGYHAMTIMREEHEKQGGVLQIALEMIKSDHHFCSSHPEADPERFYWILSVRDTGIGMSSKIIAKIFDPFFTTKSKDKGTGLGLAMVYNIIKQHKGFIDVYSEENKGSTFNIFLPIAENNEMQQLRKVIPEITIQKGKGTVLVVDDEPIIRESAKAMLEECGYSVDLAEDGIHGVEIYSVNHAKYDLIILDMVMPHMSGREAYIAMKKTNPNVKVLLASGFRHDDRVEEILRLGVTSFIQKPYTLEKISNAVYSIINNA